MIFGIVGIMVFLFGYFVGVCDFCDCYGIFWIVDEVMFGFGCSGAWFVMDLDYVIDGGFLCLDLIIFVKGVNFGYVFLGGVIISDVIY